MGTLRHTEKKSTCRNKRMKLPLIYTKGLMQSKEQDQRGLVGMDRETCGKKGDLELEGKGGMD